MSTRIALIHAVTVAMQPIAEAFTAHWPEAQIVNILDDSLAVDRGSGVDIPSGLYKRFGDLVAYADGIAAAGILFTCSAFGPAIDAAAGLTRIPVLKPNEAMFEAALAHGGKIGMLSNFAPANASMEQEFEELASRIDPRAPLSIVTVPDAMTALRSGHVDRHNGLLADAAAQLAGVDALMLAQFSASRAQAAVQARTRAPVLTSPTSAVLKLKRLIQSEALE